MNTEQISAGAWLKAGWAVFTSNALPLIGGVLVLVVVQFLAVAILGRISTILANVAGLLIGGPLYVGWCLQVLNTVRGRSEGAAVVFQGFNYFVPAVVGSICAGVAMAIGFMLLIIPGLIVAALVCLWGFAVADKNLSGIEALTFSYGVAKDHFMPFLLLVLAGVALAIVGMIPFGLGLLIVGPWLTASLAVAYEQLAGARGPAEA